MDINLHFNLYKNAIAMLTDRGYKLSYIISDIKELLKLPFILNN